MSDAHSPAPTGTVTAPARRARVLIVEDHADSREVLRMLLEIEGHEVEVAADGRRGVEVACSRHPDLALIDIGLPELDGYAVARAIREQLGGEVWLVALTSWTRPQDRQRGAAAGFDLYIAKPVAPDRIRGIIRDVMASRARV